MGILKKLLTTAACAAMFGIVMFAVSGIIMPAVQNEVMLNESVLKDDVRTNMGNIADASEDVIMGASQLGQDALSAAEPHVTGAIEMVQNITVGN